MAIGSSHDTHQVTLAAGASEQSAEDDNELCDFCGYGPGTTTPQAPDDREGFICLECGASLEGRER